MDGGQVWGGGSVQGQGKRSMVLRTVWLCRRQGPPREGAHRQLYNQGMKKENPQTPVHTSLESRQRTTETSLHLAAALLDNEPHWGPGEVLPRRPAGLRDSIDNPSLGLGLLTRWG